MGYDLMTMYDKSLAPWQKSSDRVFAELRKNGDRQLKKKLSSMMRMEMQVSMNIQDGELG